MTNAILFGLKLALEVILICYLRRFTSRYSPHQKKKHPPNKKQKENE